MKKIIIISIMLMLSACDPGYTSYLYIENKSGINLKIFIYNENKVSEFEISKEETKLIYTQKDFTPGPIMFISDSVIFEFATGNKQTFIKIDSLNNENTFYNWSNWDEQRIEKRFDRSQILTFTVLNEDVN